MYFFVLKRKCAVVALLLCVVVGLASVLLASTDVQTSAKVQDGICVPILMYHSVLKDPSAAGKYVVSPDTLESDLIWLKENGYTTVLSSDLVDFVQKNAPLPKKPVMLTFDDGHANNLLYALPLLEKYDMRAVVCVVGKYSEAYSLSEDHNPSYAYLSWEEINRLKESGRVEIANHSYDMHAQDVRKGTMKKVFESKEAYSAALRSDLERTQVLLEENCNIKPIAFSYPFGSVCADSLDIVRECGFQVSFGCAEKVNFVLDADSLYCLGRFNRPSGIATDKFMECIQKD